MQIGPRIRIGGSLGKAGDKLKKGVQKVVSNPFVQGGLGLLTGGATVPLLAGTLGGALKEKAGVGDVIKGAASGYGAGTLGKGARALGTGLFNRGGAEVASEVAGAVPDALGTPADFSSAVGAPPAPKSFLSSVGSSLKKVGTFAEAHPNTTAGALNAIGSLVPSRLENAQAAALERRAGEDEYDFEQRKRREAQYADLWSPLGTAIGTGLSGGGVARNPYAVG